MHDADCQIMIERFLKILSVECFPVLHYILRSLDRLSPKDYCARCLNDRVLDAGLHGNLVEPSVHRQQHP